jgi:hypothetical protein
LLGLIVFPPENINRAAGRATIVGTSGFAFRRGEDSQLRWRL